MMLPINYVVIEGTDLSGKTTLYSSIHRKTGFRHNIQDRSCLSMLCYARLYGRSEEVHRSRLLREISDLNNFIVVLLLPKDEILARLARRGDDMQDAVSLMKLYDIFVEEVAKIQHARNVLVVRDVMDSQSLTDFVTSRLEVYEASAPEVVGRSLQQLVSGLPTQEVQTRFEMVLPNDHRDHAVLNDPRETHYYNDILTACAKVVKREMAGENPYGKPQDLTSRRFYYNSESCISSIHFLPREGDVKVICNLRSTDVDRNGEIDVRFLAHLAALIPRTFEWPAGRIFLSVSFNSAHIRTDVVG